MKEKLIITAGNNGDRSEGRYNTNREDKWKKR